ncbi:MAG: T9SS type A sorting domain-containing protein [Ignavibacteriaceae bacterium]|nr:T9SS type A sorting domain-containing protein [Ignavibacteriaceae bacterium]
MKRFFTALLFVLFIGSVAYSQGWTNLGAFPDTSFKAKRDIHGVAVDLYGRVWVQPFYNVDSIVTPNGTVFVKPLYVFNGDGTQAPFSPIKIVTVGGVPDTLKNAGRGLRSDKDGNIYASYFDAVYKIDFKTGAGIAKVQPTVGQSLTAVAVDDNGNMFTAHVVPGTGKPLKIYDAQFNVLGNALDSTVGFSRAFHVSADGNTIYWAGYTNHCVLQYNRPDEFSPFTLQDTVAKGFDSESFGWNRKYGRLWLSSGSTNDKPNRYPGVNTYLDVATWYAWNTATGDLTDSLKWSFYPGIDSLSQRPRGIEFTPSGDTAYVCAFGGSGFAALQKAINPNPSSVKEEPGVATNYALSQNYPNPFNPTTSIKFAIPSAGFTTLKVYDMLGSEVATLVSENMNPGNYEFNFDASKLASGTYIYELRSNNIRLVNKMVLMK